MTVYGAALLAYVALANYDTLSIHGYRYDFTTYARRHLCRPSRMARARLLLTPDWDAAEARLGYRAHVCPCLLHIPLPLGGTYMFVC